LTAFGTNAASRDYDRLAASVRRVLPYLLALSTALLMGLRYEIGADWFTYSENYDSVQFLALSDALKTFDIGYAILVYVSSRLETGMVAVNLVCALIMTWGVLRFCLRQQNPSLTFLVAMPYLMIVVGMGYTRQGVAIGILLAGLADADDRAIFKLICYILLAALFHRTALLVMPLVLAPILRRNLLYAILAGLCFLLLFVLLLRDSTDQLMTTYVTQDYESSGAVVRVAMNVVPATLMLVLRRRFYMTDYQRDVFSVFALVALATLPLSLAANFSTAIDRLALFLIPLQLMVLPQLPYIFGRKKAINAQLLLLVVGYSAAVQSVWLVFATHAIYWVPYQAYGFNV
jgi:hypothetical protein